MKNKQGKSNYYNIFFIKSQVEFMIKIEIINVVNLKINQFVFFLGPDTFSKASQWVKAQHEGALSLSCIVRKHPQVPHIAQQGAWDPQSTSRGKRSSLPQTRRFLTLLPNSAGTLRSESETERKPEVPAFPGDEALFHCAKPSGVLRGQIGRASCRERV